MRTITSRCLLAVTAMLLGGSIAWAQEPEYEGHDDAGVHCLKLSSIRQSEIINNRHILFHLPGGKTYVNVLPRACPGLTRQTAFMYRTSLNELCDLDMITVLDDIGFGLTPGVSCGLGRFYPVDDADIEDIKKGYTFDRGYEGDQGDEDD